MNEPKELRTKTYIDKTTGEEITIAYLEPGERDMRLIGDAFDGLFAGGDDETEQDETEEGES